MFRSFASGLSAALAMMSLTCAAHAQTATPLSDTLHANTGTLIAEALKDEVGLAFVQDLTTQIGPRLAGSEAEARARDWATRELTRLGFENVRVQAFNIPFWSRTQESAQIVSPAPQNLIVTALGGSPATPAGGITAPIVRFTSLVALEAAGPGEIDGKIVFLDEPMTRTMNGSGYGMAVAKRRNCAAMTLARGGQACLIRSVGTQARRFPHTGMMARGDGVTGVAPAAALSPPDADQLARLLEHGPVSVSLNIQVETAAGASSGNVLAEIVGSEAPEDIVLIGCHLDSWDLGTGALDDGAGCGIVVGAAHLIAQMPTAPRRTIRIVLYGSEEVGLLGADAYARHNLADLPRHVFAAESDFGAGNIWRLQTRFGPAALPHARALQGVLAPLGVVPGDNRANGGPDVRVLQRAGVPVVTAQQNGLDYFDFHHTPDDTFDKINPETFRQNVAVYAAMTYLIADAGWDLRAAPAADEAATQ